MAEPSRTGGVPIPQQGDARYPWFCPKPTLSILFYTDYEGVNLNPDVDHIFNEFGVRILRDLLVNDDSDVADFDIVLLNRHLALANRLTPSLLSNFDEVWFFGYLQANTTSEPDNELTDPEVAALADWMATGGVVMAGDHSNERPDGADPSLNDLLSLGRAIGHRVPRAGALLGGWPAANW
jgi:hypothetical protein